jgi:hypothetical protein
VCNCRPLCIVSSTRGDPARPGFFWQLRDWDTADRYPHSAGLTSAPVDVLTSCEEDDRMMTGGLHSVACAGCHSLVDTVAWVPARVIPVDVQNRDRDLRTQQRATGGKKGIELGTVLGLGSDSGEEE